MSSDSLSRSLFAASRLPHFGRVLGAGLALLADTLRFFVMLYLAILAATFRLLFSYLAAPGELIARLGWPDLGEVMAIPFLGLRDGCEELMCLALDASGLSPDNIDTSGWDLD